MVCLLLTHLVDDKLDAVVADLKDHGVDHSGGQIPPEVLDLLREAIVRTIVSWS